VVPFDTTVAKGVVAGTDLVTLDAVGGDMYDIKAHVMGDDDALATFTLTWKATSVGAPVTFVDRVNPDTVPNPGANWIWTDTFGDLQEGLQAKLNIAQDNAGDATNACDGYLSYWSRV